jgi:hypothetical protein
MSESQIEFHTWTEERDTPQLLVEHVQIILVLRMRDVYSLARQPARLMRLRGLAQGLANHST